LKNHLTSESGVPFVTIANIDVSNHRTNKWLAAQLNVAASTVSKWCTNDAQPSIESLMHIAILLDVKVDNLLRFDTFDIA